MKRHGPAALAAGLLLLAGCGGTNDAVDRPAEAERETTSQQRTDDPRAEPPRDEQGLYNVMRVSERILSGSEPHGEEGFQTLAKMGVKTIVSVDGAKPPVVLARKHGLRYVHIPVGYDGVSDEAGRALFRLVREAEGPFYIHCHHGRHRGPAAAAVACVASGEVSGSEALQILQRAGTSKDYAGLWRDVQGYEPPEAGAELPELVAVAEVGSFAAAMARIDRSYDNLKLCEEAGWSVPESHPNLVPAQEALLLREGLREAARTSAQGYDAQFKRRLTEAENLAHSVESALRMESYPAATEQFRRVRQSCNECHAKYRN